MKLLRLTLENFKGKSITFEPDGKDMVIKGANETGKTTLVDAYLWLLTGKDSLGRADFSIKNLDDNNQVLHGLEHTVEAVIEVNEKPLKLKRTYKEQWTKKRGSAKEEFSGHTTSYFVNEVPVKKGEYEDKVDAISDGDRFKLLTPGYLMTLKWEERRKLLIKEFGGVEYEDVVAGNPEMERLEALLEGLSPEDAKKKFKSQLKTINDRIKEIPIRIDEVTKTTPDLEGIDGAQLAKELMAERQKLDDLRTKKMALQSGANLNDVRKEIAELEKERKAVSVKSSVGAERELKDLQKKVSEYGESVSRLKRDIIDLESRKGVQNHVINEAGKKEQDKLAEYKEVNSLVYGNDVCSYCKSEIKNPLTEEEFEDDKKVWLAQIVTDGKIFRSQRTEAEAEVIRIEDKVKEIKELLNKEEESHRVAEEALTVKRESYNSTGISAEEKAVKEKLDTAQKKLDGLVGSMVDSTQKIDAEMVVVEEKIDELKKPLSLIDQQKALAERVKELDGEMKQLTAEYDALTDKLYLLEEFDRIKSRMVEEKVNAFFSITKWKLFEEQINGGIEEMCEALNNGKPYSKGLNHGNRILVDVDIVNALSKQYGFAPPVWVDNAEAVTSHIVTEGQTFLMYAVPGVKELEFEVKE